MKTASEERFVNRKQAFDWLVAQGYKVSRGKFYQDCKAGFPALHRDGTVSRYQVMQYGQQLDISARTFMPDSGKEDDARKAKAEADIAEMKAERMRRDEDALWLHAETAWAQMAAIVGVLRDNLHYQFYVAQNEIVHVAGGDMDRNHEVFEMCDGLVNKAFNEIAGTSIDVKFIKSGPVA